jgi:uncharacterized membrane protein YeaQ/YmgE (transglycosylase-associated protein family)
MRILIVIVLGFVVGVLAKLMHPGRDNMGVVPTILLGIGGSLLATYAGQELGIYDAGQGAGLFGAVLGGVVILYVYGRLKSPDPSA